MRYSHNLWKAAVAIIAIVVLIIIVIIPIPQETPQWSSISVFNNLITESPIVGYANYNGTPVVATLEGRIFDLEGNLVLDLTKRVDTVGRLTGLQDMIEHPVGGILLSYTRKHPQMEVVHIDGSQEEIVFQWTRLDPDNGHTGGSMSWYKNDLYLTIGDGTICTDFGLFLERPHECMSPQETDNVLGKLIKVNTGEIIAMGLRQPWTLSLAGDRAFLFDSGDKRYDSILQVDLNKREQNFGWPIQEGIHCLEGHSCDNFLKPVAVVEHFSEEYLPPHCAIIGGPLFHGQIIWGDFCAGALWSLDPITNETERLIEQVQPLLTQIFIHNNRLIVAAGKEDGYGLYEVTSYS